MNRPPPPALLTAASYYGTLAAARCLGRHHIPVTMAESHLLAPARWSRYVTRRVDCPDLGDADRFVEWLTRFGEQEPGQVLYPTTDDLAWLFALHGEQLSKSFQLFSPPVDAVYTLLNKRLLHAAGTAAGLQTPRTWFPESAADLGQIALEARFPVLIKPQSQVLFTSHSKGSRADDLAQLVERHREFTAGSRYHRALLDFDPGVGRPMIQELHAEAAEGIYSLGGFVDEAQFVARASVKVLQRPRKLGIGLCFEEAPVRADLAQKVALLCRTVGYRGVFEAEFIVAGEHCLLIDFNPRLYSQVAFDIDRGLELPLLAYLAAKGDRVGLAREIDRARESAQGGDRVYCHHFILEVMLRSQQLSGRISSAEAERWRHWWSSHRARVTDAVADPADTLPALVDVAQHLYGYARHPRAFVRSMVLDQ